MDDPRNLPAPTDPVLRAEHFARDLAWGEFHRQWSSPYRVESDTISFIHNWFVTGAQGQQFEFDRLVTKKYATAAPPPNHLISLGYLDDYINPGTYNTLYRLTRTAVDLLKQPSTQDGAFISYRRGVSGAFAMLLEARIRATGGAPPFIDRNLVGGDEWHGRLKEKIEQAEYFICIIGPTTLDSQWVQKEINWAVEAKRTIIPVCHGGIRLTSLPPELQSAQGYEIKAVPLEESAADYDDAVNFVLGSMWLRNP